MANKDDIDVSSGFDDFGDFDVNIDESGTKRDRVAQPSKIRTDYLPSMKSGFIEGLKRELSSKMPYTAAAVDHVSSIYNEAKNMTQQFAAEATPLVRSIGRSTNRLMPLVRPFMPKGVYDKITGKLSQIPDEQGELSEEEKQAQQISADINAAFQGSDANAQVRSNMENVIGGMRHKATMGALGGLLNQMQTTNKFLTTSLMAYMKKDLELQYRQLYTQRDIASTLRGTAKVLEAELKNITHNSGLPDMIKAKDFQRRTTKMDKVRDYTANFWKNLMGNLKNNVVAQLKSALEGVEMAASGAADMKEMMEEMEGQPLSLKTLAFKGLFNLGGRVLGSKLTGKIAKMGQTALGGFDSIFENLNNNLIRGIENYSRKDNMLGNLLSMILPYRPENDTKVQNALSKNPTQPVQFDISTREAIVTIIPGYLAKLNKLVEDIKDPSKQHEELVYSTDERQFVTRGSLDEKANDVIDKIINPEVYNAEDHLQVVTTGRAIQGTSAAGIKRWFNTKAKDGGGRTNRELVELFFQNLARSERHELDVQALEAYVKNKDINAGVAEYIRVATDGLGNASKRIVGYILDSLKRSDGEYNATAIRKYQKALDNVAPYYDTNAMTENFSKVMNDMSEEKRERIFAILEERGLYDRKEGKLKLGAINQATAAKRSQKSLGNSLNSWTSREIIEAMSREEAFTVNGGLERILDLGNGYITDVTNTAKNIASKTTKELGTIVDKGKAKLGTLTGNWVRGVFGDQMTDAFKLMSSALLDKYQRSNGVATVALDLALVSGEFPESDLQLIRNFAEESMKEKDSDKIQEMRLGVIASIKNQDLVNIFSEATSGIITQKDAINHFGTMKQRVNMLMDDKVFKGAMDTLKAKLTDVKNKGKKAKGFLGRIKARIVDGVKKIKEEVASEEAAEANAANATPESAEATKSEASKKPGLIEKSKETGDKLVEKAKKAGKSISEAVDETTSIKEDINEVLVKGLDEYKVHITSMDENVARIYTLLEKKLGNLSEEEINELHEKAQKLKEEMAAQSEAYKPKKGFGNKLKSFFNGTVSVLNPFKSINAAKIAAKYNLDSTPESAFHADFQTYFAYRKEMDVCMASLMGRKSIIANTARGLLSGAGSIIGGTARGLGSAAQGLYTAGGKILGGAFPALGYLGSGLIQGGATIGRGLLDLGWNVGERSWRLMKDTVKLGKRTLFGTGPSQPTEQWYDLYRKDEVGETKDWMKHPFLSAHTQKKGIFHIGPDGKSTGKIMKTDDIAGPVMDKNGKQLVNEDDWNIGLVNIEGKSISQKAKEHGSGALIQLGGGSLIGGLLSGIGSLIGGGLSGGGAVLSKLLGVNWDITKMFGRGLKNTWTGIKGIGSNLAGALGIGTSEKAQRKKYSVIIGEFEKVNKTLDAIRTEGLPTKKKKVAGDSDGDGDRDGSYEDQQKQDEEKKEKRSFRSMLLGLVGKEEKDGKVVKKKTEDTWYGKMFNWIKNPSNWINGVLLTGGAFIVGHFIKKYGAKTVLETVTNAVVKTAEIVGGIATGVGWIVDKAIDIWKWLKKKFGWDDAKPTPEQLGARQNLIQANAAAHAFRPGGGLVKGPKDIPGTISKPPAGKPNVPKAPTTPNGPKGPRAKAPAPKVGKPGAAGVPGGKKLPMRDAHGRFISSKNPPKVGVDDIVHTLDKLDDAGDAAKTGRPLVQFLEKIWNQAKTWCSNGGKSKSVGKYFDKVIRTLKVMQAQTAIGWFFGFLATMFGADPRPAIKFGDRLCLGTVKRADQAGHLLATIGNFFLTIAKHIPIIGPFIRLFAFISKAALWLLKIIAKVYAWIMDKVPELMGCITIVMVEWFDAKAQDVAYETGNENYMTEYWQAEHELFGSSALGWGMAGLEMLDMVNSFTARFKGVAKAKAALVVSILWVTYQGGRWLRGGIVNAGVATVNRINGDIKASDTAFTAYRGQRDILQQSEEGKRRLALMEQRGGAADQVNRSRSEDLARSRIDKESYLEKWSGWLLGDDESSRISRYGARTRHQMRAQLYALTNALCSNECMPAIVIQQLFDLLDRFVPEWVKGNKWSELVIGGIALLCRGSSTATSKLPREKMLEEYKAKIVKLSKSKEPPTEGAGGLGTKINDVAFQTTPYAYWWVFHQLPNAVNVIVSYIDNLLQRGKEDREAAEQFEAYERRRQTDAKIRLVSKSTRAEENKHISNIDNIFGNSLHTGVVVSAAFDNAHVIFNDYLANNGDQWPSNGVYEYGNAIFGIVVFEIKQQPFDSIACKTQAMKSVSSSIADRYKAETKVEINDKKLPVLTCKHNDLFKPVACKELVAEGQSDNTVYYYAAALLKTDIVPAPVETKVNTEAARTAAPQGAVKKPPVPEKGKGPDVVKPNPLPESVKPKTKAYKPREDRKPVMAGKILLPYPDETKEEYEARFKYEYERWMAKYAEPIISYYTDFGKKAAVKWRNLQKANGQEPSGFFVPTKDGYEVYAVDPKTVPQKTEETPKEEAAKDKTASTTPTPESAKQPAPEVKPTSMERPPAVDEPKKAPKEEQDWKAMFESQQGELNALKAMISGENPTANLLKQLVELQTKNNELTEANGDAQKAQTDVFGRNLALLGKQKPQVVIMPATGEQSKAYTPPDTPLNIRQSV